MGDTTVGKQWKGQPHATLTTPEKQQATMEEQKRYDKPESVTIDVYCALRGIRDPVRLAGMRAFTEITRATTDDWDNIFKTF